MAVIDRLIAQGISVILQSKRSELPELYDYPVVGKYAKMIAEMIPVGLDETPVGEIIQDSNALQGILINVVKNRDQIFPKKEKVAPVALPEFVDVLCQCSHCGRSNLITGDQLRDLTRK